MAPSSALPYLIGMAVNRDGRLRGEPSAIFSRAEIRWLGAVVITAVVASAALAMVSDQTIADLLGGGSAPTSQQTNADG